MIVKIILTGRPPVPPVPWPPVPSVPLSSVG
jgi:hypothetical protein